MRKKGFFFVQPTLIKTIILRPFGIHAPSSSCDVPKIKHYLSLKTNRQLASQLDPSGLFYIRTSSACAVRLNTFAINSTVMILPVLQSQWDTLGCISSYFTAGIALISMIISKTVNQSHARNTKTFKKLGMFLKSPFCPLPLC